MEQMVGIFLRGSAICLILSACGGGNSSTSVQTPPPPTTPTNLQVSSHDGYTALQWDNVSNATSYNIYWSTQTGVNKTNGNKISHQQSTFNHGVLINGQNYYYVLAANNEYGESGISNEVSAQPVEAIGVDPLFVNQWHLNDNNASQQGINVQSAWSVCGAGNTCRGEGIRIAVVDDGLQIAHPDLVANIASGLSYNYLTDSNDPTPADPGNAHGTSVAGIIAARDYNDEGVRGIAPRANLVAYNLLTYFTFETEADAMTRGSPDVHISSNSWGFEDNTGELLETSLSWKTAINSGLANGRNGLGTIYVFAAGNGGLSVDNSNYDGYANHRAVIAVAALKDTGSKSSYSEAGANILISAPGGEFCSGGPVITTTDLTGVSGYNTNSTVDDYSNKNYTQCMNGTSAATPMVSGAVALMLQANPNLGWRDVRYILATTARQNESSDPEWATNGASPGLPINHKYGFGALDVDAAVAKAKVWTNLGQQLTVEANQQVGRAIPDNIASGITDTININASGITHIEAVEITFNAADHSYAGDLQIILTSPAGTKSVLAQTHACLQWNGTSYVSLQPCSSSYNNWVFSSVRQLDEAADGVWTLTVKDGAKFDTGTFQSWALKIYGRAGL